MLRSVLLARCSPLSFAVGAASTDADAVPSHSQHAVAPRTGSPLTRSAFACAQDDSPPTFIAPGGSDAKLKADSAASPALCVWPPNYKYWCLLDVFSQSNGRFIQTDILPVRDNCANVATFAMTVRAGRSTSGNPTIASNTGYSCTDTDPRSQSGALQLCASCLYPQIPHSMLCDLS